VEIILKPIGEVVEGIPRLDKAMKHPHHKKSRYLLTSKIRIYDEYVEGLKGLEEYSHCIVIWYMHLEKTLKLTLRPWGDENLPIVGIFATRFPPRPNKIGVTVAEIIEVNPPYISLKGMDAWTGSPIIDIKPYDYYDIVKNPKVPNWFHRRWARWGSEKSYDKIAPWLGPYKNYSMK